MNQKLLCLLVSACWLGSATAAQAQADFRPGYIVPLSGDTVRGLADYRSGVRNAEVCRFRATATAEAVAYGPAQLRGYGFASGRQYRAQLLTAIDSVQYQYVPPPKPVFMEVLAAGALNLYLLRTRAGVDRFFVAPAQQPASRPATELLPSRPAGSDNLTRAYLQANLYRGVLTELMADCPAVRMEVASVPCTATALTGIVQRYNACRATAATGATAGAAVPGAPARAAARPSGRVSLSVVAGVERSRFSVTGESFMAKGDFTSVAPTVGLGLTIPITAASEKLSLRVEALVEHQRYNDAFIGGINFGPATYEKVKLNLTYLRVPVLLRYTYPTGRLRPFAQAGVSYAQRLHFDTAVQLGRANSAGTVEYEPAKPLEDVVAGVVGYEIGLVGSLGVHLPSIKGRALTLELRTEASSSLIATSGINSSQQRYFALLSYNFTK